MRLALRDIPKRRFRAVHSRMLNGRRAILLLRVVMLGGPMP